MSETINPRDKFTRIIYDVEKAFNNGKDQTIRDIQTEIARLRIKCATSTDEAEKAEITGQINALNDKIQSIRDLEKFKKIYKLSLYRRFQYAKREELIAYLNEVNPKVAVDETTVNTKRESYLASQRELDEVVRRYMINYDESLLETITSLQTKVNEKLNEFKAASTSCRSNEDIKYENMSQEQLSKIAIEQLNLSDDEKNAIESLSTTITINGYSKEELVALAVTKIDRKIDDIMEGIPVRTRIKNIANQIEKLRESETGKITTTLWDINETTGQLFNQPFEVENDIATLEGAVQRNNDVNARLLDTNNKISGTITSIKETTEMIKNMIELATNKGSKTDFNSIYETFRRKYDDVSSSLNDEQKKSLDEIGNALKQLSKRTIFTKNQKELLKNADTLKTLKALYIKDIEETNKICGTNFDPENVVIESLGEHDNNLDGSNNENCLDILNHKSREIANAIKDNRSESQKLTTHVSSVDKTALRDAINAETRKLANFIEVDLPYDDPEKKGYNTIMDSIIEKLNDPVKKLQNIQKGTILGTNEEIIKEAISQAKRTDTDVKNTATTFKNGVETVISMASGTYTEETTRRPTRV